MALTVRRGVVHFVGLIEMQVMSFVAVAGSRGRAPSVVKFINLLV
jgi:hypothetical protein